MTKYCLLLIYEKQTTSISFCDTWSIFFAKVTKHPFVARSRPFCRIMATRRKHHRDYDRLGNFLSFTTSTSSGACDWWGFTSLALIDVVKRPGNYTWFLFFFLFQTRRKTFKLRLIEKKNKRHKTQIFLPKQYYRTWKNS